MAMAVVDGISTHYQVLGSGPALLMFSPGGFDSSLESWRTVGVYPRLGLVDALSERYTCVLLDRRESGQSGGRVERISWSSYSPKPWACSTTCRSSAHVMGGCVGCSTAVALSVAHPERVLSMVLYSPAGARSTA